MKQLYGTKSVNAAAIVSVCWKELPPHEKARYHKMAADDKFRYYNEKGEYEKTLKRIKAEMKEPNCMNSTMTTRFAYVESPQETAASCPSPPLPQAEPRSHVECVPMPPCVDEQGKEIDLPPYSSQSIAFLASKLDASSIDFLIKALK